MPGNNRGFALHKKHASYSATNKTGTLGHGISQQHFCIQPIFEKVITFTSISCIDRRDSRLSKPCAGYFISLNKGQPEIIICARIINNVRVDLRLA